ncbi:hypothetical protein [Paenibacillus sp. IHBB 10380]|uniref:hypothetical protein n=1 Tax=Paenibacillus sp. IHBB 10380 TaxID=1566358 RepID=UPI0005CFCD32|nr:hypothetical protein [Paenibacillus sp. IHBB 10380]AJS59798.1 hypothetical protein UB51_16405 [Paenibacillus sp. IHBB 10380]
MNPRHQENKQLQQYLNDKLDELPLLEPKHGFTDKVMQAIGSIDSSSTARYTSAGPKWKQNAFHGCVAAAATVLFVSTGAFHKVLTINDQMVQLSAYIEKISLYLVS